MARLFVAFELRNGDFLQLKVSSAADVAQNCERLARFGKNPQPQTPDTERPGSGRGSRGRGSFRDRGRGGRGGRGSGRGSFRGRGRGGHDDAAAASSFSPRGSPAKKPPIHWRRHDLAKKYMQQYAAAASEAAGRPLDPMLTAWLTRCFAGGYPGKPPGEVERNDALTVEDMKLAARQMEDAIEFWQSESDESGPLPVVLDIGGGGHGVPNAIGQEGMQALVDVLVANREHVHVRLVRAHSAQLGDGGALEVIRLMKAIPWPIWEMHLSHNGIGTETAMRLLQALHLSEHYPFVGSRKGQLNPLWLRLEYNRIDANLFLQGCDAAELTYCIPPDRQTCQTKRCGVNKGLAPALHLPFFRSQIVGLSQLLKNRSAPKANPAVVKRIAGQGAAARGADADTLAAQLERVQLDDTEHGGDSNGGDSNDGDTGAGTTKLAPAHAAGDAAASPSPAEQVLVVLDSSAVVHMLSAEFELAEAAVHGDVHAKRARDALFSFRNIQRVEASRRIFSLVLPHTVGAELDYQKDAPGLHGKVVRDFLRDYGIKQRALEAGVLQELSKEEAEADIIQRGALVGMALSRNDEMIANVALHIRRELLREGGTGDALTRRSVLLLTEDGNMLNAAAKAGVPSVRMTTLNKAMCAYDRKHKAPLYALDAPAGTLFATFWDEVLPDDAAKVADSETIAERVVRDNAQETAEQRVEAIEKGLAWLQLLKASLASDNAEDARTQLVASAAELGGEAGLGTAMDALAELLNASRGDMRLAVSAADPRLLLD